MERCYRCGASSEKAELYDAISEKEIVKICSRCQFKENLPIIRISKVSPEPLSERHQTVRERLSHLSGRSNRRKEQVKEETEKVIKQNEDLRKVIARKYEEDLKISDPNLQADISGESGMVRNFHWIIMRARRARHMTQRELADKIQEPEIAIKMAEKGILPREREMLVKKIQDALKIQITKIPYDTYTKLPPQETQGQKSQYDENYKENYQNNYEEELKLDSEKERRWTIGDLLRIKKRVKTEENEISISDAMNEEDSKSEEHK